MLTDHIRDTASLLESHRGIQIFGTFEHDFISMLKSFLQWGVRQCILTSFCWVRAREQHNTRQYGHPSSSSLRNGLGNVLKLNAHGPHPRRQHRFWNRIAVFQYSAPSSTILFQCWNHSWKIFVQCLLLHQTCLRKKQRKIWKKKNSPGFFLFFKARIGYVSDSYPIRNRYAKR